MWMLSLLKFVAFFGGGEKKPRSQIDSVSRGLNILFCGHDLLQSAVLIFRILQAPISSHICQMRRTKSMKLSKA
jgi:hypothetical protein